MKKWFCLLAVLALIGCRDRDTFKKADYSKPILETTNSAAGADRKARVDTTQPRPQTEAPAPATTGTTNHAGTKE